MGSLKQATQANKPQKTSREDSTYRKGLARILRKFDDGFDASDRMENALNFFDPEWEARDQRFIRKFAMWTKEGRSPAIESLLVLAKFGVNTDRAVSVSAIANNLRIPFKEAMLRCVSLAALGLCERSETDRSGRSYNILFAPAALIRFSLGVLSLAHFTDDEVAHLALFFRPEVEGKRESYAVSLISQAVDARDEFESHPTEESGDLNLLAHSVKLYLAQHHAPQPVGVIAREIGVPVGVVSYAILLHAFGEFPLLREPPYWSDRSKISLLRVFDDEDVNEPVDIADLSKEDAKTIFGIAAAGNIGAMPRDEAKALLQHAAQASPSYTDPAIPGPRQAPHATPACPECHTPLETYDGYTNAWVCPRCEAEDQGDDEWPGEFDSGVFHSATDPEPCGHDALDKDGACLGCGVSVLPNEIIPCPDCEDDMTRMEDPDYGLGWMCEGCKIVIRDVAPDSIIRDGHRPQTRFSEEEVGEITDEDKRCPECQELRAWDDFTGRFLCSNDGCVAYDDDYDLDHSDDEDEAEEPTPGLAKGFGNAADLHILTERVKNAEAAIEKMRAPHPEDLKVRVIAIESRLGGRAMPGNLEERLKNLEARLTSQEQDLIDIDSKYNRALEELGVLTDAVEGHMTTVNAHTKRALERAVERAKKAAKREDDDVSEG
jgi:rubrerythrin